MENNYLQLVYLRVFCNINENVDTEVLAYTYCTTYHLAKLSAMKLCCEYRINML